jgi:polysaccharide export outer membrane protein
MIHSQSVFAAEYPLDAGDEIEITVFQHPELYKKATISESGKVNFALIGTVDLKGKTESEVAKTITNAYASGGFVNNPEVFVVVNYLSRNASVIGRVHKPGQYQIATGETILDFISKAGGITEDGSTWVSLYRDKGEAIQIDLFGSAESKINRNSAIKKGDVIRVTPAEVFFTSGEVKKPDSYMLFEDMTLRQGIAVSGGMTDKATEKGLRIIRKAPDGSLVNREADLDEKIQSSDIIFVKESLF